MLWFVLAIPVVLALASAWRSPRGPRPLRETPSQWKNLHTRRNFLRLGFGVVGSTALVYSGVDESVEAWHAAEVKNEATDAASHWLHEGGERFWFAYWLAFAVIDGSVGSSGLTRFGRRCFQSMLVGLPMLWITQRVLGGSRPQEEPHGPDYRPLADDNAASGHSFISSVPCFVAARTVESKAGSTAAYALAPWVGWSRLNDRKHYPSQILLGWLIGYMAAEGAVLGEPGTKVPAKAGDST